MASPVEVLHSRQKRPLIQDDKLKRGDYCAARLLSADIAVIEKAKPLPIGTQSAEVHANLG